MNKANDISAELASMGSSLAGLSRKMPYFVTQGYFEQFGDSLQQTMKEISEPDIATAWPKSMPYAAPDGYFNELTGALVAAAMDSGLTADVPKTIPFHTPAGYFETLPQQMLAAAKATDPVKKETRFIPLRRRKMLRPIQWAAAAVLVVTIGMGGYEAYFNRQFNNPEQMLASVNNNDIQDYLQHTYRLDVSHITDNNEINNIPLDNKEIIQYLDETGWDMTE